MERFISLTGSNCTMPNAGSTVGEQTRLLVFGPEVEVTAERRTFQRHSKYTKDIIAESTSINFSYRSSLFYEDNLNKIIFAIVNVIVFLIQKLIISLFNRWIICITLFVKLISVQSLLPPIRKNAFVSALLKKTRGNGNSESLSGRLN